MSAKFLYALPLAAFALIAAKPAPFVAPPLPSMAAPPQVAAARAQSDDSANSQFFIMFLPNRSLEHSYTVFGRVISGMDAVDKIAPGEPPPEPTKIVSAHLGV